jgi:hypothetical protein
MPSPTGVTRLVRNKKRSAQGQRRKREDRKKGTINFFTAFPVAPAEISKAKAPAAKKAAAAK